MDNKNDFQQVFIVLILILSNTFVLTVGMEFQGINLFSHASLFDFY